MKGGIDPRFRLSRVRSTARRDEPARKVRRQLEALGARSLVYQNTLSTLDKETGSCSPKRGQVCECGPPGAFSIIFARRQADHHA